MITFIKQILIVIFIFSYFAMYSNGINLNFQKITYEDGLTDDRYNDFILEDKRGFVWISSIDGLNRYDGNKIKTYRYESGMKGTNIQGNLFEDKNGNIWFTTYIGINCYQADLDTIINYQIPIDSNQLITKGYRVFYLDTLSNYLWLKADKRIYKWSIDSIGKFEHLPNESISYFFNVGLNEDGFLNKIISYTNNDSVRFTYLEKNNTYKDFKIPNTNKTINLGRTKWLFYKGDKLLIFDEDKPIFLKQLNTKKQKIITDVINYRANSIFILTKNDGLWLYDWKNEEIIKEWKSNEINQFSLLTNSPRKAFLSPSKYLWISHKNKGLNYSYLYVNNFSNPLEGLTDKNVELISIMQSKDGNIWVGTKFNGIYVFKPNGEKVHHFSHPLSKTDESELWHIIESKNGDILATTTKSIYHLNLNLGIKNIISNSDTLIFWFMSPLSKNRVFLSTSNGLLELNKNQNKYTLKYAPEFFPYKDPNFIQLFEAKNKVFIPYESNELWVYEITLDTLKKVSKNDSCNLQFYGFYESKKKKDTIWAGTSNGLKIITPETEIKSVFSDNSELANGNVYGIVEDYNGVLWLTTNRGLWRYDPNIESRPIHFEGADGLSGDLFSLYNSALYASDGTIWLGNNRGLVVFHPDSIVVHKEVPKIYLEELLVNDTYSFKNSISYNNMLKLPYNQNTFSFDIRPISLYKTKQNKIHYYIENYDKDTLLVNNAEKMRYTKLEPGVYNLKICSEDANGHKSDLKQLLTIKIIPPYWEKWWFYLIYVFFTVSTFLLLIRLITSRKEKKMEAERIKAEMKAEMKAKKMEAERMEAEMKALRSQMNPHFLLNAIYSIKGLVLSSKAKKASYYLNKFASLLQKVLVNSEKQKINLDNELGSLELYIQLESLRFDNNFNYSLYIDSSIPTDFIRIPPLILQPFVENAILHGLSNKTSDPKKLSINILRRGNFIVIEIIDNGIGRKSSAKLSRNSNRKSMGINNTKKRIKNGHSKNDIQIKDLMDEKRKATGTKVIIQIFTPL